MALDLGPDDFLVMPTKVHIMRYMGRNDYGYRWWRLACGASMSEDTWDFGGYTPSQAEIDTYGLGTCGNCLRTKPLALTKEGE